MYLSGQNKYSFISVYDKCPSFYFAFKSTFIYKGYFKASVGVSFEIQICILFVVYETLKSSYRSDLE